jgi:hypothetical protein
MSSHGASSTPVPSFSAAVIKGISVFFKKTIPNSIKDTAQSMKDRRRHRHRHRQSKRLPINNQSSSYMEIMERNDQYQQERSAHFASQILEIGSIANDSALQMSKASSSSKSNFNFNPNNNNKDPDP